MGFSLPTLTFELRDLGLTPRWRSTVAKSEDLAIMLAEKSSNQYLIHPDVNGEYSFFNAMLQFDLHYQAFYDGEHKILEVFSTEQSLIFNLLTDKQTNLFVDVDVNECIIKAVGPLCIDGKLKLKSDLAIAANALCILDSIDFAGTIILNAQQGIGLLASLCATQLHITAAYLYQSAEINLSHYDLSVQAFQQIHGAKTDTETLRMLSEQCEITGEFFVQKSCFITANNLLLGDNHSVTQIDLPAEHHIHVINMMLQRQSRTIIGQNLKTESSQWIVDEALLIDKRALLELHNVRLNAKTIESRGNCALNNCVVTNQLMNIHCGSLLLSHSNLIGDEVNAFAGAFTIENHSQVALKKSLISDKKVNFVLNKSVANIQEQILLFGNITIHRANIHAGMFRAYQTVTVDKSQINSKAFFELQGDLKLKKIIIQAHTVLFAGDLSIDDATIAATSVDYQSQHGLVVKNFVETDRLSITGSNIQDHLIFKSSRLEFNYCMVTQHVLVENASLVGVDDAHICHNISGILSLKQSQFISQNSLNSLLGSHIKLCKHSQILFTNIGSTGDISAQDSAIYCDYLLQNGASLNVESSKILINKTLLAKNTQVTLDAGSIVSAANISLCDYSNLRLQGVSVLAAREQVTIGVSSNLQSSNSTLCTGKFVALGRAELSASLLSANELLIYDQFAAQNTTFIQVDARISLAQTAQMQLTSSHMKARDIETFGVLDVVKSSIHADANIAFWSTSKISLQESSTILADDAILRGQLVTKKKLVETNESAPTPTTIALKINKQMDISPLCDITGDEDLFIDADAISQSGKIELTSNFCAKGRQFTNLGSVIAPSIYLGFDDTVINHGLFSAKRMTVHSNFMNVLGQVYARESLACSGFFSLNLGVVAANNYINDSFCSLNAGLIAPNLFADLEYIFSFTNLAAVAKTVTIMCMPAHASGIQLFSMIPGFISTAVNLYRLSNQLDWQTLQNMRRHEYMPILCQIKNAVMFGQGFASHASSFGSEIANWDESFTKLTQHPDIWASEMQATLQVVDWKEMGIQTAGAFCGSYTDTSLLHINAGASFAGNTSKTNFLHLNYGAEHSLFSHNINTYSLYNSGHSGGLTSSFSATTINNRGVLSGKNQFILRANKVFNSETGSIQGSKANFTVDDFHQYGSLSIDHGRLNIQHFTDSTLAQTKLTDVALLGKTLDQNGDCQLNNVYIQADEQVKIGEQAHVFTDNVCIETQDFMHAGKLEYANGLTIKAETVFIADGAVVNGQRTSEDELFIPVQPVENSDVKDEKEFKPQHILNISAQKVTLNGHLTGGDYTLIQGKDTDTKNADGTKKIDLCDELVIGDSAEISLTYGAIDAKFANISGKTTLDGFHVAISETRLNQDAQLQLNNTSYTGDVIESSGSLVLDHSYLNVANTHLTTTAREKLIDSQLSSKNILDESQLSYQGQSGIDTENYQHTGHVQKIAQPEDSQSKNLFYVQAKTGRFDGSGDIDNGYYNIEHLSDGTEFVTGRGKYSLYMTSESLSFTTQDAFHLYDHIDRDCDISVQAADILFATNYDSVHDLTLISTVGDVVLTSAIQSANLYAKSARNILTNNSINTSATLSFEAEGGYYNYGGTLNGDLVAVKAAEIINITPGSTAAAQGTALPMGGAGIINARSKLFLEATKGNIENHGGIMRAGDYAQLLAAGDVVNLCNERSYRGQYDILKEFNGGLISGGNGTSTDGIGLYIKAEGLVISDASDFVSNGSNYIEGVKGVSFTARQHTYVSLDRTDKTWYGKKTHVIETSTTVKGSVVHSNNGRNIIQSGEGGVTSVATRFSSPGGTDIYAKGNIQLFSLKAQNHRFESHSNFWGLSKKERDHIYESSTPTLFLDNGTTRICSAEGNVDARGAYFIGAGDLSIKAKGRIQFGVDILEHELNAKTRSFNLKAPGLGAWDAYKQGGTVWDMATAEDATLAKLNSLSNSHNAAELLANSSNLGIDLANTTGSMLRGLAKGAITDELMARYGLGSATGFAPSLTLSMTESSTKSRFQTQAQGGVDRGGNVRLEAGEGIDLENGVRVHAGGNLEIDAPEVIAHAAALQSSVKQTTQSESIGATLTGQLQNVGVTYSKTQTSSTHYINAELSAGGNMLLHNQDNAMEKLELDGANLIAGSLDANIHQLIIKDKQDESKTKTKSASLSTNGQFSVYAGHGVDKITQQKSGIHVTDGINTNSHKVHVDETYMEGGSITTNGENRFATDKLFSVALHDERQYQGVGMSGNINDFNRLIDGKPMNLAGEQTFATAALMLDGVDYAATQTAVIFGEKGTILDIDMLQGEIHTESADGKVIQRNNSMHLQLDIPLTNHDYLENGIANIQAGEATIYEFFNTKPNPEEPVAFERPEPLKLVENNSEEKSAADLKKKKQAHPGSDKHKKNPKKTEPELSSKIAQAIVGDALKHLKFDTPEAERAFKKTLANAQHEKETTGKVSQKTEVSLKKQITNALIKALKAGTEEGWGKFVEQLGPEYNQKLIKLLSNPDTLSQASVKTYLGTKGALITFVFNLASASLDDEIAHGDVLKHGVATTAVDFTFGVVLKFGLEKLAIGEAAGPIGWGLVVIDVLDSFYSQAQINKFIDQGVSNLYEAQSLYRDGHPFAGWALERAAADQLGSAVRAQCGHIIVEMMKPVVAKIESMLDQPLVQKTASQRFFQPDLELKPQNTRQRALSW